MLERLLALFVIASAVTLATTAHAEFSTDYDEVLAAIDTGASFYDPGLHYQDVVTDQLAGRGVTFSPYLYYSMDPFDVLGSLANFSDSDHVQSFSIHFETPVTDAAFGPWIATGAVLHVTTLLHGSVVESVDFVNPTLDPPPILGFLDTLIDEIHIDVGAERTIIGGVGFSLPSDQDGDGLPDDADDCPLDANPDQLDLDGDGAGDACDACPVDSHNDSDGDGTCDSDDLCPLDAANDADGDGVCGDIDTCSSDAANDIDGDGACADVDVCPEDAANDADADGLCESDDDCPTVANANQSDVDGDGTGDACERDDDGDGVIDDYDDCPLDENADQADADADGVGDVCDADADGDGVTDGADVCLGTPRSTPVLVNGCSVGQQCACGAAWKNHGAYVSCIANATNALLAGGLITRADKDALQSAAAASACGRK